MKHLRPQAAWPKLAALAVLATSALACSRAGDPKPSLTLRKAAQPLVVTDASTALAILLPEPVDPAFDDLEVPADAATKGMWSEVFDWPLNGLHSVLLPTGKVLTYGTPTGAPSTQDGRTFDIWSPEAGFGAASHRTDFDSQRANSFCSSAAFNSDGSLLITGGNSPLESSVFSTASETLEASPFLLASERWYGTMITLPDGRFLMMGGSGPYEALRAYQDPAAAIAAGSVAMTPEIYEPETGFRSLFGAYSREAFGPDHHRYWYPRAWVAPDGDVFGISSEQLWRLDYSGDGAVTSLGGFKTGVNTTTKPNIGPTSTAAMFAPGRILQVGGNGYHDGHATPSSALATVIDINGDGPVVTETNRMNHARQWANLTVLPDGKVVVTGGTAYANNGGSDAVYAAELWDPTDESWTEAASASVIRVYHSAAILMPNGTVLSTGGGAPGPVNNLNAEIYYPPSLFRSTSGGAALAPRTRPLAVSALASDYGEILNVDLSGSPTVEKAVLVGTSSVTHSFNTTQRRIELPFLQAESRVAVELPASGYLAPPGYYHLFFLDEASVPSRSVILALGSSVAAAPVPVALPEGLEVTFESVNLSDHVLATGDDNLGILRALEPDLSEAEERATRFIVREGLSNPDCASLESVAAPGKWLRQLDDRLRLDADDGSETFASDATFCPEHGLSGTGVTLRSERFEASVIRHRGLELWLDPETADEDFKADATFIVRSESTPEISVAAPIIQAGEKAKYAPEPALSNATFSWDFGDGSAPTGESGAADVNHRFVSAGLYLVTLTIRLSDGRRVNHSFIQAVGPALVPGNAQSSSLFAASGGTQEERLWVVNPDNDSVTVLDVDALERVAEVPVGAAPRGIARAEDGRLWVTLRDEAAMVALDPESLSVEERVEFSAGARPYGIVFSPVDGTGYVSLDGSGSVVEFNPQTAKVTKSLEVGATPRGLALSADGERLLVSRFISPPASGESTLDVETDTALGELRVIDLPDFDSARIVSLAFSDRVDGSVQGRGIVNYLGAPALSPDGRTAWIPSKQDNIARGTLRDGTALDFQNTVRAVASRVDLLTESERSDGRVDFDNSGLARAMLVHPTGAYAFVALETSREVAVLNALLGTELFRIDVGRAPQALALAVDGSQLYVENFMDRSVSVVDLTPLVKYGVFDADVVASLDSVTTDKLSPEVLLGKQLFYDASDPRLARDGYLSCATCHAEGEHDGRVWDFSGQGEGLRNTISLLGMHDRVGRLHWSGNFDEVQDFEGQIRSLALGSGLLLDASFEQGTVSEPLGDPKAGLSEELDALAAYVSALSSLPHTPFREGDELSELGQEGLETFLRVGCNDCHYGTSFSDEEHVQLYDIGTLKPSSGQRLFGPLEGIDVPSLRGVFATAPYLHDGSASTLEAAIGAHDFVRLDPEELVQIVAFLHELDGDAPAVAHLGCFDGAQNGNETGLDCGGSCVGCEGDPPDGAGGATSSGAGGATSSGAGGATSSGAGGAESSGTGGATSASAGGATSSSSGGATSSGAAGATSSSSGGATSSGAGPGTSGDAGSGGAAGLGGATASGSGGAESSAVGGASGTGGGASAANASAAGGAPSEAGASGSVGDTSEAGAAGAGGEPPDDSDASHGAGSDGCSCHVVGSSSSRSSPLLGMALILSLLTRRRSGRTARRERAGRLGQL